MLQWQTGAKQLDAECKAGDHNLRTPFVPPGRPFKRELHGQTIGIVGAGNIGRQVARRARAFGMKVKAVTRTLRPEQYADFDGGVKTTSGAEGAANLASLFEEADFVVLTCGLTDDTRGMVDAPLLRRMKGDAVLINVGRGDLVVERDLYQSLEAGSIGGAVIDVWWRYPGRGDAADEKECWGSHRDCPFHELGNVVLTPHASGWSTGHVRRRAQLIAENLDALAQGGALQNVVRGARL